MPIPTFKKKPLVAIPTVMPVEVQRATDEQDLPVDAEISMWAEVVSSEVDGQEGPANVCIRIVAADEARNLNLTYRGKNKPTNVLSFPAEVDLPEQAEAELRLLGDVVICAEVVRVEAANQGKSTSDHFAHMVVHGMLHLFGYDHETEADADVMEELEREILRRLSVSDPYREC